MATGSSAPLAIAPVRAAGAIVYWTTSHSSALKGLEPGDESVVPVLAPGPVTQASSSCIGCHARALG